MKKERAGERNKAAAGRERWEREQRQSDRTEGLLTNGPNLHLKFRLCLDVIYPDYIYTWM